MTMPRAIPIRREKVIDEQGNIVELAIWKVPPTRDNAARIRYRLAFVRRGERNPAVLYDCHPPKGHHRHLEGIEEPYHFVDVDQLLMDFTADVRRVTGDATWPRR
jgi:pyruvate-formate lyase-activating enzyme